jgi:hypothetical protein
MAQRAFAGDRFEADRAVCGTCASLIAFLAMARASATGRRWLARGLVLATLAWLAGALVDGLGDPTRGFSGVLAARAPGGRLPGALADSSPAVGARRRAKAGHTVVYAGLVPVWRRAAGFLAAAAGSVLVSAVQPAARYPARVGLLLGLLLAGLLAAGPGLRARLATPSTEVAPPPPSTAADFGSTGGFAVRWLVWKSVPALVGAHAWLGVGPGQFEREFPPYRDAEEIDLSTQHHATPSPIEVEHPHNDWVLAVAESGILGGSLRIAFLATMLAFALLALGSAEGGLAALGSAAIGVLANACFNGPLFENAASSTVAFACFGALAARAPPRESPGLVSRMAAPLALGLALLLAWPAFTLARHGRALAALAHARTVEIQGGVRQLAEEVEPIVGAALAARPD